jgi:hypothetical protein
LYAPDLQRAVVVVVVGVRDRKKASGARRYCMEVGL